MRSFVRAAVAVAACFVSSSALAVQPPPPPPPPTCVDSPKAGLNPSAQTVAEGTWLGGVLTPTTVELNGSPSKGDTYQWVQTAGPTVTLSHAREDKASFSTPNVPAGGATLKFTLTVTGCDGKSATDEAIVNVTDVLTNRPPVAAASATPATVNEGAPFTLDGSGSSDPDGDALAYTWEQLVGTGYVLVSHDASVQLTAPPVPYPNGATLTFRLTVTDGQLSAVAQQLVNVRWVNDPPVARAACTPEVDEGGDVFLDATGSTDADDGIASYLWKELEGGPTVVLGADALSKDAFTFDAPMLTSGKSDTMRLSVTVTDKGGLSTSAECSVTVLDKTPPVLHVANRTVEATSPTGAFVTFTATATDAFDGDEPAEFVSCNRASGGEFAVGVTSVACSAHDVAGNYANASFDVTVTDTTPPTITVPANITREATGASGAAVTFSATATDLVDGAVTPRCTPASGSTFALGETTVTCDATDAHGNAAEPASFTVTVRDTTPPTLTVPADTSAEATGASGAAVTFSATATDLVDGAVTPDCTPASGSTFALGETIVSCTATDAHHNTSSARTFKVTVVDTTPPSLSVPANMNVLATSAAGAVVTFTASATDLVDGAVTPSCTPASGSTFSPGTTTVSCTAQDAHGNRSLASTFTVSVSFTFVGFFQPVDNLPALNVVKGGATVPLKWKLQGEGGVEITDVKVVSSVRAGPVTCAATGLEEAIEATTTGGTALRYDTTAMQFVFNWQTPKQPGTCWRVEVQFTDGLPAHGANFKLK